MSQLFAESVVELSLSGCGNRLSHGIRPRRAFLIRLAISLGGRFRHVGSNAVTDFFSHTEGRRAGFKLDIRNDQNIGVSLRRFWAQCIYQELTIRIEYFTHGSFRRSSVSNAQTPNVASMIDLRTVCTLRMQPSISSSVSNATIASG